MRTIVKKTITLETKRFDFDNEFAYLEVWANAQLKDNYFAEKDALYPDGSLRKGEHKYFYCPYSGSDTEKEIKPIDYTKFTRFDRLFYYNDEGEVVRIDGILAADCISPALAKEKP